MNSYLVSATSEEVDFEQAIFIMIVSELSKFCFCDFWIHGITRRHFFAVIWVPTDIGFDISIFVLHVSDDERKILFRNRSLCYLELERMHGSIIFCDDDESTRIFIETVDNTWSFDTIDY